jgi:DMSO/TMAO reductase YedYZ molybdopterin-dependent catalytic subunit
VLRRLFDLATFAYDGLRYTDPSLPPVTPSDQFYTVTKNVIDPSVDRPLWRLDVVGLVERTRTYRFTDLAALPPVTQETTLMCISNGVGDALMSNAVWKGTPLRGLIDAAGPRAGVVEVVLRAVDGYVDTIPFEKAIEPTTLVVYEMNGEPLPERHGYPVRMIVPGMYGEKNVKWITRIELVDRDVQGFYEQQGWGPDFVVPIRTRFFVPSDGQPLSLSGPIRLKGIAFSGDRGISRVEVSLDAGQTWMEARIDHQGAPTAWSIWSYDWRPTRAGEHRLVVRAYDAAGRPQSAEERGIVPTGGRGYPRITVQVQA